MTGSFIPVYIICMATSVLSFVLYSFLKKSYDPERRALKDAVIVGEKKE